MAKVLFIALSTLIVAVCSAAASVNLSSFFQPLERSERFIPTSNLTIEREVAAAKSFFEAARKAARKTDTATRDREDFSRPDIAEVRKPPALELNEAASRSVVTQVETVSPRADKRVATAQRIHQIEPVVSRNPVTLPVFRPNLSPPSSIAAISTANPKRSLVVAAISKRQKRQVARARKQKRYVTSEKRSETRRLKRNVWVMGVFR